MEQESGLSTKSERIISSITGSIRNGDYKTGDAILSINAAAQRFGVARKTVIRAYDKLVMQGYIESRPQRGFFVVNKRPGIKLRVLLIMHSFEGHFQTLYNEFREQVDDLCEVEVFFHHYNIKILELIISRNASVYDLFIISSFNHPGIPRLIGRVPSAKILVISRNDRLELKYNSITQDFYRGTYQSLVSARERTGNYQRLVLSFPETSGHPESLERGFVDFCEDHGIHYRIFDSLKNCEIKKGDAYLVIDDCDLIKLLKVCKVRNWIPGKDVGVISYNETPLKEVMRDGITVISCNFSLMATEMAGFIRHRTAVQETIPISLILRKSL